MNCFVSVAVLIVEVFLSLCGDSILGQTFSDIQVILVDDGSPDQCGKICDEYAKQDNRVEVIHKENGGLSDARNAGIPYAKGEYIIFLDSDDYIENDMITDRYKLLHILCLVSWCKDMVFFFHLFISKPCLIKTAGGRTT